MTYINNFCADVGTANCPCPLAETGDCLICSRLAGREKCDCPWAGVCVYNEYIQNDRVVRSKRGNESVPILKKIWYGSDLLVLVLKVSKGFALKATQPGSFVFLNCKGKSEFCNVPVSVMKADTEKGRIYLALKVISGKTKNIAEEEDSLMIRGVYRNGLLGKGRAGLVEDVRWAGNRKSPGPTETGGSRMPSLHEQDLKRWLIITKGVGFAPAVNLLRWADGRVYADVLTDTDKVGNEIVRDYLHGDVGGAFRNVSIAQPSLKELVESWDEGSVESAERLPVGGYSQRNYDRVMILASDYYIRTLSRAMGIPAEKLVFSNNFRMCCGEGICGACVHVDGQGQISKMCKCREFDIEELYNDNDAAL